MADIERELEIFKIGRSRFIFPPDITEDELRFISMIIYSYIQTVKYKGNHPAIWSGEEKAPRHDPNNNKDKKPKEQAGVS